MTRLDQGTGRLSLRNSILVWVAGIVIGWGCAVVLFYQLIRDSSEDRGANAPALMATSEETIGVADIAPAAGPAPEAEPRAGDETATETAEAQATAKSRPGKTAAEAERQLH